MAVPLSLVGTFVAMYVLGYSLDNLSLMALTISTGFVVDDAIVMIENISRYIEEGEPPMEAALKGAEQIGFTILSLTVSLIAVLIPLLFMGGVVGRLFREFAVTLAVTVIISAVVSLTLTPMMSARILKRVAAGTAGPFPCGLRTRLHATDRVLRPHAQNRSAISDPHPAGRARNPGAHHLSVHHHPEGLLPRAGHRRHSGHFAGAGNHLVRRHGGEAAGTRPGDSARPGRGESLVLHRCGRHQYHLEQRPHVHQFETARGPPDERFRRNPQAAEEPAAGARGSPSTCSPFRTLRSTIA